MLVLLQLALVLFELAHGGGHVLAVDDCIAMEHAGALEGGSGKAPALLLSMRGR